MKRNRIKDYIKNTIVICGILLLIWTILGYSKSAVLNKANLAMFVSDAVPSALVVIIAAVALAIDGMRK
ncbi:MAG: hypothetical protein J6M66_01775 [Lachnospiraceae bacterium]|nr:hypothetical protein [Lachnospiraceae bacterium]